MKRCGCAVLAAVVLSSAVYFSVDNTPTNWQVVDPYVLARPNQDKWESLWGDVAPEEELLRRNLNTGGAGGYTPPPSPGVVTPEEVAEAIGEALESLPADLSLGGNTDAVTSALSQALSVLVAGADPAQLTSTLTDPAAMNKVLENGGGGSVTAFLNSGKRVTEAVEALSNLINVMFGRRRLLVDVASLTQSQLNEAISNMGTTDPDIYYLYAALLGSAGAPSSVVRLYELKGASVTKLLETGRESRRRLLETAGDFDHATLVMYTGTNVNDTEVRSSGDTVEAPGDLVFAFPDSFSASEVTSMLEALLGVGVEDSVSSYASSSARSKMVKKKILAAMTEIGFTGASSTYSEADSDVSTSGEVNSGVYYPSAEFARGFAREVARDAPVSSLDLIRVQAVVFWRVDDEDSYHYSVIWTVQLEENRCFLCDRRDQSSSETESESGSEFKSSEVSSSQTNFRDSSRYLCSRGGDYTYGGYTYEMAMSQFTTTMPCNTCGQFVLTCPNNAEQWAAYSSEQAVLATFTGSAAVEQSKELGGEAIVDPFDVPQKKVFYQENGAPATDEQFEKAKVLVDGTTIVIPLKSD